MADDIKKLLEKHREEIKNHFNVVAEDLKGEIRQVAEGVTTNTEHLERLQPMQRSLEEVKADVDAIKTTLGGTESEKPLKQRVADLELKVKPG